MTVSTRASCGQGTVHAWLDGTEYTYTGPLGYVNEDVPPAGVQRALLVKTGIYRNVSSQKLLIDFANIEYSANPVQISP